MRSVLRQYNPCAALHGGACARACGNLTATVQLFIGALVARQFAWLAGELTGLRVGRRVFTMYLHRVYVVCVVLQFVASRQ